MEKKRQRYWVKGSLDTFDALHGVVRIPLEELFAMDARGETQLIDVYLESVREDILRVWDTNKSSFIPVEGN